MVSFITKVEERPSGLGLRRDGLDFTFVLEHGEEPALVIIVVLIHLIHWVDLI